VLLFCCTIQEIELEAWLSAQDELRLEVDESSLCHQQDTSTPPDLIAALSLHRDSYSKVLSAGGNNSSDDGGDAGCPGNTSDLCSQGGSGSLEFGVDDAGGGDLPPGEPLSYCSSTEGEEEWSEQQEEEEEEEEDGVKPAGALILPYHMSMLNDHGRTVKYKAGIQGEAA
jgi:hypothetical protein